LSNSSITQSFFIRSLPGLLAARVLFAFEELDMPLTIQFVKLCEILSGIAIFTEWSPFLNSAVEILQGWSNGFNASTGVLFQLLVQWLENAIVDFSSVIKQFTQTFTPEEELICIHETNKLHLLI
jgi:hypothetical protein